MNERPKLYVTELEEVLFWEKLTFLIQEHTDKGLKGYVKKFNYRRHPKIFGKIEEDKFWIWKQGMLSGSVFYPIFHGEIRSRKGKVQLEMNSKPNSLGGIVFILLSIILGISMAVWLIFFQTYNSLMEKVLYLIIAIIIFSFFQFFPNITYTLSKRKFRIFLERELKLKRIN